MLAPRQDMAVTYLNSQGKGGALYYLCKIKQLKIPAWREEGQLILREGTCFSLRQWLLLGCLGHSGWSHSNCNRLHWLVNYYKKTDMMLEVRSVQNVGWSEGGVGKREWGVEKNKVNHIHNCIHLFHLLKNKKRRCAFQFMLASSCCLFRQE